MSMIAGSTPTMTILFVAVFGLLLLCMYLISVINRSKKYGYLTNMMGACMQKNKPLGLIVDRAGQVIPVMIERDERNRGLIKHKELTLIHPDMALASVTRMRIKNGPEMVLYPLPFFFPFSVHAASALVQIAESIRKDPDFSWLPSELRVIELLFNGTDTFERDCRMVVTDATVNGYPIPESWYPVDPVEEDEEEFDEDEKSQFDEGEEE